MSIGEKIKALRKQKMISQEELSLELGVCRQTINKWETDKAQPNTENIISLSSIFEVSPDYFLSSKTVTNNECENIKSQISCTDIYNLISKTKLTVLIVCSVINGLLFLIGVLWTVVFGMVAFSTSIGHDSVGTDDIGTSEFVVMLIVSFVLLVAEVLLLVSIFRNQQKIKKANTTEEQQ